jgi:hypothetical protein
VAVRIDANADSLIRTASLPNYNSTYTLMGWFMRLADRDDYSTLFYLGTDSASAYDLATTDVDGTTLALWVSGVAVNGSTWAQDTWTHVAVVRESPTSLKLYLNGVLDITNTSDAGTGRSASQRLEVAAYGIIQWLNGRVAGIKLWDAGLTLAEVQQEIHTLRPQRLTDLNGWYPCWPGSGERVRDYSGWGRDWTEEGTLTDEDPPPVSYGAPLWVVQVVPVTAQFARPSADVSVGGWSTHTGATTNLYAVIDEATADDADYVRSSLDPSNDEYRWRFGPLNDPQVGTGHTFRYRIKVADSSDAQRIDLTVTLYRADGTTVVASQTHPDVGGTIVAGSFTLTESEADSIPGGDYSTGLVGGAKAHTPLG